MLADTVLCRGLTEGDRPLKVFGYLPQASVKSDPGVKPFAPPTIRRGDRNIYVGKWQALRGLKVDNIFGPNTEQVTKEWQNDNRLEPDGIVGPATWKLALDSDDGPAPAPIPTPVSKPELARMPTIKVVKAKYYQPGPRKYPVTNIVCHTMEAAEKPTTAEGVAHYFYLGCPDINGKERKASCNVCIDADSIVQCVLESDIAYHAAGINHCSIGIEHAGYANQGAAGWADAYSVSMLKLSAFYAAMMVKQFNIPVVWVEAEGLLNGEPGFTSHAEVSKACVLATQRKLTTSSYFNKENPSKPRSNHYDPGKDFPIDTYLELVRAEVNK